MQCPSCQAQMPDGAVLCVACGYHVQQGQHLATAYDAQVEAEALTNPYAAPRAESTGPLLRGINIHKLDPSARIGLLEERVRELEYRINSTRLMSPNFGARMFAVLGYWLLGYFIFAFLIGGAVMLIGIIAAALANVA